MVRFALSTAWHAARAQDAHRLLALPARMGFDGIELSSVDAALLDDVRRLRDDGLPTIVSLHAPCPVPYPGAARLDDLASLDEARRAAAVEFTRRTVDVASELGARAVVLHLGTVEGLVPQPVIVAALEAGDIRRVQALLAEGLARRRERVGPHLDRCLHSLETLTAHAAGSGVALAAETRYEYTDIPDLEEFEDILRTYGERGVWYWHDVGHAHTQQTLGLATPQAYLDRYGSRLLGFHLHDARGTRDHLPPGEGEVDFGFLAAFASPDLLRVLEVAAVHPEERVASSLRHVSTLAESAS